MAKKEVKKACPNCGGTSFMNTSEGVLCKTCKTIINKFVPINDKCEK